MPKVKSTYTTKGARHSPTKTSSTKSSATKTSRAKKDNKKSTNTKTTTPPAESDDPDEPSVTATPPQIPKELFLQVIIAKLEASKTCDWFELSKVVNDASIPVVGDKQKGAKKKVKAEEGGWTGTKLHDLYHDLILPNLKAGKVIWYEGLSPNPPPTSNFATARQLATAPPQPPKKARGRKSTTSSVDTTDSGNTTLVSETGKQTKSSKSSKPAKPSKLSKESKNATSDEKDVTPSPARSARSSRKAVSYREDLMSGGEEEDFDQEGEVESEEDEDEDGGAVDELDNEGLEDEVHEQGVEDGDVE